MVARWKGVGGLGEKGEGIKKYRLVVDADSGQWCRGALDARNKITWIAGVLWRKGTAWPLSE